MKTGEKIRYLRNEMGITQSSLCGDFMTRNMLSQIENGSANPSLSTIYYIAEKLQVPPGYLLTETDDLLAFCKLGSMDAILDAYGRHAYEECAELCGKLPASDNELALILADCYYHIGCSCFEDGRLAEARDALLAANVYSSKTFYPHENVENGIRMYLSMIDALYEKRLPADVDGLADGVFSRMHETSLYLHILHMIDADKPETTESAARLFDELRIKNPQMRKHINARLSAAAHNADRAAELLTELVSELEEEKEPVFLYFVLSDLEGAYRATLNYEGAYRASLKKSELYDKLVGKIDKK